jgi:hypothetical protein
MATSNSIDFSQNRNEIIEDALQLLGEFGTDQTVQASDLVVCNRFLNKMVKHWENQGVHLWKRREAVLPLAVGTSNYIFGGASADHSAELDDFVKTTLDSSAISTSSTISVDSSDGMEIDDVIGVELDSDIIQWTTISNVSGTTITLSDALSGDAGEGNVVYSYTTLLTMPLDIMDIRLRDYNNKDIPTNRLSHEEYFNLNNKTGTNGRVTSWYYSRQKDYGKLFVWYPSDTVQDTLQITYLKKIEDFDTAIDDPDFPQEWLLTLTYNLACIIGPVYGKEVKIGSYVETKAQQFLSEMLSWDNEHASAQVVLSYRGGR